MLVLRRVVVASVLVGTVACTGGGSGRGESDSTSPGPTMGTSCLDHSSTVRRDSPAGNGDVFLIDARVSKIDDCVDEVTFEFRSDGRPLPPGYSVEYGVGPFVDFTSGDEFEPAGEAYLVLRFANTAVFAPTFPDAPPEPTYTGQESIAPSGMNHLLEARIVQGSDGMIQWVIGLDSERPFNIDGSSLALLPLPESTTTTSPSGSSTSTTIPPTSTTTSTAATAKIVVRIA